MGVGRVLSWGEGGAGELGRGGEASTGANEMLTAAVGTGGKGAETRDCRPASAFSFLRICGFTRGFT